MSDAAQTRQVRVADHDYTVWYRDDGAPNCVQVHVQSRHGYKIAFRRLPMSSARARAAVAAATESTP
jgi:hypothetical protein